MRVVVQRVRRAEVRVEGEVVGRIGPGLLVLLGAGQGDGAADVGWLVDKVVNLRVFEDDAGKMNRSLLDAGGGLLVVSQFTLYGDCRHGRRPLRASPYSVNCETASSPPPTSSSERFILPASSSKMRRFTILSTIHATSAAPSPVPAPRSTRSPRPMRPTTSPSTRTSARETRCTTARMPRCMARARTARNPDARCGGPAGDAAGTFGDTLPAAC